MDHRYRKFLAVAEEGSFSAAAKKLRVSQPAITLAVASLERAFGCKLYTRKKYAVELTEDGRIVADSAAKIAREIDKMKAALAAGGSGKPYRVGLIDSLAHLIYTSTDLLVNNNLEVMVDNSKRILRDLLNGDIDIGLIAGQPSTPSRELIVHVLHNEEFVFVCAPHNKPLNVTNEIHDWLAVNQDSTTYHHFIRMFKKTGLSVTPIFYSTSMDLLKEMAAAGKGTALLPRHAVQPQIDSGALVIIPTKPLYRPIWAVARKDHETMIERLTSSVDELLARTPA